MKTRILTSILLILIVLYPALFGGWSFALLIAAVVGCASYEWLHSLSGYRHWGIPVSGVLALWILGMPWITQSHPVLLFPYFAIMMVALWALPVFVSSFSEDACFSAMAFAVIMALVILSISRMTQLGQPYFWTLLLTTYGSDTGAYFTGRFLGKHKMVPRISPKKTWEGFFGGWAVGFLLAFLISLFYVSKLNFWMNFMLCLMAPVFAELGDLCFSTFKRNHDLKDFSSVLPGHGGVLDRVDSLLMNFILFGMLSYLFF